jgi:hypothetical protein
MRPTEQCLARIFAFAGASLRPMTRGTLHFTGGGGGGGGPGGGGGGGGCGGGAVVVALHEIVSDWHGGFRLSSRTVPCAVCDPGNVPVTVASGRSIEKECGSPLIGALPVMLPTENVHVFPGTSVTLNLVTAEPSGDTSSSTVPPATCVPVYVAPGMWSAPAVAARIEPPSAPASMAVTSSLRRDRPHTKG